MEAEKRSRRKNKVNGSAHPGYTGGVELIIIYRLFIFENNLQTITPFLDNKFIFTLYVS
jgi:hypothetical protein